MKKTSIAYRIFVVFVVITQLNAILPLSVAAAPLPISHPQTSIANIQSSNASLENPLSISRVQSSYVAGETIVTFNITNNLPPTNQPDLSGAVTITDTVNILASFVITDDMNTLRNVTVEETLVNGATLQDASDNPTVNANTLTWNVPDLPPQGTASLTMTVSTPAQGSAFVEIDTGAQASAEEWGGVVSVSARPAVIIPNGINGAYTSATPDAESFDGEMLWKSTEFGQDPLAMFDYVKGLEYDPYKGSLRGTRGTLWGEAGNSVDQSSLLIAMLRATGIPARYRHGSLSTANAQILIESIFPTQTGVAGTLPAGAQVSDPVNDAALIALVQDHWWVEAYFPGQGWTNLDPSFANAQSGDVFATPGGNDQIAELPDNIRHKMRFTLQVEQYNQFPVGGTGLLLSTPFDKTFTVAELAGKKILFSHMVDTQDSGGIYQNTTHTYTPYITVDSPDRMILGDSYQDLLTNFPLASSYTMGSWLTFEIQDPDGNVETFTRPIKDLLGPDVRLNGGTPNIAISDTTPASFNISDIFTTWVLPNTVPDTVLERWSGLAYASMVKVSQQSQKLSALTNVDPLTPEQTATAQDAIFETQLGLANALALMGLNYAVQADAELSAIEQGTRVHFTYDRPRIVTIASIYDTLTETRNWNVDLRTTFAQTFVYPGQAATAQFTANWLKGVSESYLEAETLESITELPAVSTANVFDEMATQNITPITLTSADTVYLELYDLPEDTKALMLTSLNEGKHVILPAEPVIVNGEERTGWWVFNPATGETIGVMENGLHNAAAEDFKFTVKITKKVQGTYSKISKGLGKMLDLIAKLVQQAMSGGAPRISSNIGAWRYFPAHLCPIENCGVEQFFLEDNISTAPIPLPEMLFSYHTTGEMRSYAVNTLPITGSGSGDPAFTLAATPGNATITPNQTTNFATTINNNFNGDFRVAVYSPDGWDVTLDTAGNITAQTTSGATAGNYTIQLVAQSLAHPELIETAQHTVTISSPQSFTLDYVAETNITVPVGQPVANTVTNQTNDGEAEIPNSAFRLDLTNNSDTEKTFNVTVSGAPADWVVLNGVRQNTANITLPPFSVSHVGLYVVPTTLPAAGTSFTMNVTAGDGGSLSDNVNIPWTMPQQAFNYLTLQPENIYVAATGSADFSVTMTNVGNGNGDFPISASLPPISASVSSLPASVSLTSGETQSFTATLNTTNLPLGSRFPVIMGSPAPGSYTQYALAEALIISNMTELVFRAAENAGETCTLGEPGLSGSLESLAFSMVHLEGSCQSGNCNLSLRDNVIAATSSTALYAGIVSPDLTSIGLFESAALSLASHTDNADILNDLQSISDAVGVLDGEVCTWSQHKPALKWMPGYDAALIGEDSTYDLALTNEGTVATTYALTVTLPSGTQTFTPIVNPGETNSIAFPISGTAINLYDLNATVTAIDAPSVRDDAIARLNVVDKFVQLTAVNPSPNFVETGASSTLVNIEVANIANIVQDVTAQTTIFAPGGAVSYTGDTPLTILIGAPRTYPLQTVGTSGWNAGVYTVSVQLLDAGTGTALIPSESGSGYGFLGVGQAVGIKHAVNPAIVAPGTITITTMITTELLVDGLITNTVASQQLVTDNGGLQITGGEAANQNILPAVPLAPLAVLSTNAISRTEDVSATIVYTGSWATVNNILSSHASNGTYTWSSTSGDTATFQFSGTWAHLGFITDRNGGNAEIFIDGVSQGTLDLYAPQSLCYSGECLKDVTYGDLTDSTHTLEIVVTGNSHPNANGAQVRLDHIDTWDGTSYPDGTVEQDNPRILRTKYLADYAEPAASGGSYMSDGAVYNNSSAWFPFTGDSASFVAMARYNSHRVHVWVDGIWQGDVLIYNRTPISRTFSFSGFGPGPHIMRVSAFRNEPNIDAFITPAVGPDYEPPVYTGLVRYEEDNPMLTYNGYPVDKRPVSWSSRNAPQASEFSYMLSSTISDTVSLTFDGSWLNIGLRTRSGGGLADVSIDGVYFGTIDSSSTAENVRSYQYDLITGTHTVSLTVLGPTYLDYFEIWDSTPVTDTFQNAARAVESGRTHVSNAVSDGTHENAIQGDYVSSGLSNSQANVWYSFVGDSFTFYGLSAPSGGSAEVYVDGMLIDTVDFTYPFSVQPIAFHYDGFVFGAHTVRIHNVASMQMDGFASNPTNLNTYQPTTEWWDNTPAGNGAPFFGTVGIGAGMAAGDINGDGDVEIVVTADDVVNFGSMFVYRGDGQDTGDGDPIIWTHDFGGGAYRTWVSAPALADLDGQPGAEIVVAAGNQLYAFHNDGTTYWVTDTVSIFETLTAPAVGNLDLDPEPEIVVNLGDFIEIRESDGSLSWSASYPNHTNPPVLADLTGDGQLDILVTGWSDEVRLYDYNYGSPTLVWTQTLTSTMNGTFGVPAVADIDGLQPGGDPGPEIAVSHNGALTVLNGEDGSVVWTTPLGAGNPGGVSIADLDGDGEVEIVTGMRYEFETGRFGMIYALNADGSLLWNAIAEDSTSANNAATLDLDGDGIYEVAWNGKEQGFTIFNGLDGSILFNEPLVFSLTGTDYPLIVDTDNDNQAEIIVPALGGIRVFGYGTTWGEARPIWNQHSYHISNVNDDLTIPFSEANSWDVHNTYRTQWPARFVLPVYAVSLTHTTALTGMTVLTNTFNVAPGLSNNPNYGWDFTVGWESPVVTRTFNVQLSNLQPGETRLVAQGTTVDYTTPGGQNHLALPPLYVSVPHIISMESPTQTVGAGVTAIFSVTLTNPTGVGALYTLSTGGLPSNWVNLPAPVNVPAGSSVSVPITVTIPTDEAAAVFPFNVSVTTDFGISDQVGGQLTVLGPLVEVGITPSTQMVTTGDSGTYTLTITNLENSVRTYDLSSMGLAAVSLPAQISVGANDTANVSFTAQAVSEGENPFTIMAISASASGQDTASIVGDGFQQVVVAITPGTGSSGAGVPTPFTAVVTNLGTVAESFDLSANVPAGWESEIKLLGSPISQVLVAPGTSNAVELQLLVTPPNNASPGNYDFSVTAQSGTLVSATTGGTVQVQNLGVVATFTSGPSNLPPNGSGTWNVEITNTGQLVDTYDLTPFGPLAPFAALSQDSVTLNPGATQTVQMTINGFDFALERDYPVGVHAQSQTQSNIENEDTAMLAVTALENIDIQLLPTSQSISGTGQVAFTMIVTNTGNVSITPNLSVDASPYAAVDITAGKLTIPPQASVFMVVRIDAPGNGTYTLTATANGITAQASDTATIVVDGLESAVTTMKIYLPLVVK